MNTELHYKVQLPTPMKNEHENYLSRRQRYINTGALQTR